MPFDFNDAEGQRGDFDLMPDGTICIVVAKLRPGGAGDGDWLKCSERTGCNMLDFEFTVDGGEFDRRKFWGLFVTDGNTEGHEKASKITRSRLRGMLESANGVSPTDLSTAASAKRQVASWGDFDGLRFVAKVGIEKSKDPQYSDKNVMRAAITPDDEGYISLGGGVAKPKATASGGAAKKPSWAG